MDQDVVPSPTAAGGAETIPARRKFLGRVVALFWEILEWLSFWKKPQVTQPDSSSDSIAAGDETAAYATPSTTPAPSVNHNVSASIPLSSPVIGVIPSQENIVSEFLPTLRS
jgi:hypothetical protein